MKKILAKIEYRGTNYKGWQIQPDQETVEGVIERVLRKICGEPIDLRACSRTDAGVHAMGQVADMLVPERIHLSKLMSGLNSLLPDDVAIRDLVQVPVEFCARKNNRGKRYVYQIYNSPLPSAFETELYLWRREPFDLKRMEEAAQHFVGTHDFSAFRGKGCTQPVTEKEIKRVLFNVEYGERFRKIRISVEGSGFLKNMVRIMIGTLLDINRKRLAPSAIKIALKTGNRKEAGITAPAKGLFLESVTYHPDPFADRSGETWNSA